MKKKYEILIVDDNSENIKIAISILKSDKYNFSYALDAKQAVEILKTKRFDLLLLDVMMPEVDGFRLARLIKNTPVVEETPIIFLTERTDNDSIDEGFSIGAVDYVTKPFHPVELRSRVSNHLELLNFREEFKHNSIELTSEMNALQDRNYTELELAQREIIEILSEIMESDSGETACHVKRVAKISKALAVYEGHLEEHEIETLYVAAPLHDIGKVLVDKKILHKNGDLTTDEFHAMQEHSFHAVKMLKNSKKGIIKAARVIAYEHHENYDGSGYPRGIKGESIHIFSRIVAIADVLDTLTHERHYEKAWSFEEAVKYIIDLKGTKFDPRLIDVFINHLEIFKDIVEDNTCK